MKILDHDSCPQLAGNTTRFEQAVKPILQALRNFAQTLPFPPTHFEEDWQDALIELWQRLHECPMGQEHEWAQQRIFRRFLTHNTERYRKKTRTISCEPQELEQSSSEEYPMKIYYSSEMEQLTNDVSCVRTAKIVDCLRRQSDLDRKIVFMRLDSFSFREIAAALKLTKTAAIYRFRQTILALKAAVQ